MILCHPSSHFVLLTYRLQGFRYHFSSRMITQGLHPVLGYVTPSGFGDNHQLYHKLIPITPQYISISIYHDCKHHHKHHPAPHTIITKRRCRDAPWCVRKHGETHPPMRENTPIRTHQGASLQHFTTQRITKAAAKRWIFRLRTIKFPGNRMRPSRTDMIFSGNESLTLPTLQSVLTNYIL